MAKVLIFAVAALLFSQAALAVDWHELKGEHFIVYFEKDDKFAKDVLDKAEVYYRRIASELGYQRYSEFWLWEKRVKIYIYPDCASFLKATNQPQWSRGMADYKNKEIVSFVWSEGFLESLLPHEIAHLVFRDFVGFKSEIPLWLDEGVAQWAEEQKRQDMKHKVKQLFEQDSLLSLVDMTKIDIRTVKNNEIVYIRSTRTKKGDKGVVFLSGENLVMTFYLQSVSVVGFLVEKYGSDRFADFCRQLRDGKSLNDALKFAYPVYMRNVDELDKLWRKYLEEI